VFVAPEPAIGVFVLPDMSTVTCDPASTANCPPAGAVSGTWIINTANPTELDIGMYLATLPCASASMVGSLEPSSVLGTLDCSNAVDRTLDKALYISNNESQLQCNGTVTPFGNVLGEFYGLFWNAIPGVAFNTWGTKQYTLVSSLLGGFRVVAINAKLLMAYTVSSPIGSPG